jgi:hypothetical protein
MLETPGPQPGGDTDHTEDDTGRRTDRYYCEAGVENSHRSDSSAVSVLANQQTSSAVLVVCRNSDRGQLDADINPPVCAADRPLERTS